VISLIKICANEWIDDMVRPYMPSDMIAKMKEFLNLHLILLMLWHTNLWRKWTKCLWHFYPFTMCDGWMGV